MIYNQETFAKFRALAITEVDKFIIGKTYYSNTYPDNFIFLGWEERNPKLPDIEDNSYFGPHRNLLMRIQIKYIGGKDKTKLQNCPDRNIGVSYNPWLIFDSKEILLQCKKELIINFGNEDNY